MYQINPLTGGLTSIATVASGLVNAMKVAVDPAGKFLYVGDSTSIEIYSINPVTGGLTPTSFPVGIGGGSWDIVIDPAGKFIYTAAGSGISVYAINASTGGLTNVNTILSLTNTFGRMAVDPIGRFAYVADGAGGLIYSYQVNPTTGALTAVGTPVMHSTVANGLLPHRYITVDATGKFVYSVCQTLIPGIINNDTVVVDAIDPLTGSLSLQSWTASGNNSQFVTTTWTIQ